LFLDNQMKSEVRAAKIWNFRTSFLGLASNKARLTITAIQSTIGLAAKLVVIRGQGELHQSNLAKLHSKNRWLKVFWEPLQKGQTHEFKSTLETNLPILVQEGKMSQAMFQSRCLSPAWSLRPHSLNHTSGVKGEVLPEEAKTNSWADLTEKRPEGDGAHDHLSNEITWGIWIFKIFWIESGSNRSYNNCKFQYLTLGRINSATMKGGSSNRLTFGLGLKFGKVGIQGEFQTSIFSPLEIEMQAPNSTTFLFFNKHFQILEDRELKGAF